MQFLSALLKYTVNRKEKFVERTKAKIAKRVKEAAKRALRAQVSADAVIDNEYVRSRVGTDGSCSVQTELMRDTADGTIAVCPLTTNKTDKRAVLIAEGLLRERTSAPVIEDSDSSEDGSDNELDLTGLEDHAPPCDYPTNDTPVARDHDPSSTANSHAAVYNPTTIPAPTDEGAPLCSEPGTPVAPYGAFQFL